MVESASLVLIATIPIYKDVATQSILVVLVVGVSGERTNRDRRTHLAPLTAANQLDAGARCSRSIASRPWRKSDQIKDKETAP
jgi:hypothetical protein